MENLNKQKLFQEWPEKAGDNMEFHNQFDHCFGG